MKQQFNVYLPPDLVARAKHRAIDDQLSLSDLTYKALETYMDSNKTNSLPPLRLQPIVHVTDLAASIRFYEALGGTLIVGSRDGDWAQIRIGDSELGLLARPVNPEQNEGEVELCFESDVPVEFWEQKLQTQDVVIVRGAADEAFGEQLQVQAPGGLLIKINRIDPSTFS